MHAGYATAARVLAAIALVSLIVHGKVLSALVSLLTNGGNMMALLLGLSGALYPVLGLLAVAGLWAARSWGFHAFYAHLILATLLLGISFIPGLPALLPPELRIWGVIAVNLLALFAASACHRRLVKAQN